MHGHVYIHFTDSPVTETECSKTVCTKMHSCIRSRPNLVVDRDSSVDTVSRYRLHGPGIESRWGGGFFRRRPDRPWGPPSLQYN